MTSHVRVAIEFCSSDMEESKTRDESASGKKKYLGKYCVAGGPNHQSCKNNSLVPGISLHEFPKPGHKLRDVWVKFVQRHRHQWQPSSYSALCSAHFEPNCFHHRLDIGVEESEEGFKTKRVLDRTTAFPSIDTVLPENPCHVVLPWERRLVSFLYAILSVH